MIFTYAIINFPSKFPDYSITQGTRFWEFFMGFGDFVGNSSAVGRLREMLARDHFPQAVILAGAQGSGKYTLALMLARAMNCLERPGARAAGADAKEEGTGSFAFDIAAEKDDSLKDPVTDWAAGFLRPVLELRAHWAGAAPGGAVRGGGRGAGEPSRNGQERDANFCADASGRAGDTARSAADDDQGRPGAARDPTDLLPAG